MTKTFLLEDLCCPNCAAKIENAVSKLDGVVNASVNFITTKLTIEADEGKMAEIVKQTRKIVKKQEPDVTVREL